MSILSPKTVTIFPKKKNVIKCIWNQYIEDNTIVNKGNLTNGKYIFICYKRIFDFEIKSENKGINIGFVIGGGVILIAIAIIIIIICRRKKVNQGEREMISVDKEKEE